MTAAPEGPNENALYELLPTVFRQRDIAQGYPLLALTKVFDHIRDRLAADISDLEQDWFIATCPLDYVPLIGALLGVEIAKPVRPEHRALVADTLAFRRRKGTAARCRSSFATAPVGTRSIHRVRRRPPVHGRLPTWSRRSLCPWRCCVSGGCRFSR